MRYGVVVGLQHLEIAKDLVSKSIQSSQFNPCRENNNI
jgi:hypothetical protein